MDDVQLDRTDIEILRHVEEHGTDDIGALSERLNLSKSTVYYRIDSLEEAGVITGVTVDTDPLSLGLEMLVLTEVYVVHEPGYAEDIGERLAEIDGVQRVLYTMGDVDFVVMSRTQNRDQLNDLIDETVKIEGVDGTSSTFVMDELPVASGVTTTLSEAMIDNAVDE